MHTLSIFLAVALFAASPLAAQQNESPELDIPRSSDPGLQSPLRTFARDQYQMWKAPFRASTRKFIKYEVPFAAIVGGMIASDRVTRGWLPESAERTRWSNRVSQLGGPYALIGYSGAMYLASRATGDKRARETGWLSLIAVAHSQLITEAIKVATNRERPEKSNGSGGFWDGGKSFPSGHASGSFAAATVFAYQYREKKWVPITAYALASTVAAARVSGRKHHISDVTVGAALGFLTGRFVYGEHHDPSYDPEVRHAFTPSVRMLSSVRLSERAPLAAPVHGLDLVWCF